MALSPREILQHMEVPSGGEGHPWPGAKGIYILGSLEPVRISLYSQQVRAFNLIYALVCEERIKKSTRIAIIGAGPAGLAAARAAAHFGAKCFVFEKSDRPMDVFCRGGTGNDRRYVHPSIENWPAPGSDNEKASRLPFLQWTAGPPKHVADQINKDFENAVGVELHVSVSAKIANGGGQWTIDYESEEWPSRTEPPKRCGGRLEHIEVLIFAIGFGRDNATVEAPGYWDDDSSVWTGIRQHGGSVLISGDGDGAIIEAVSAAVKSKRGHEELTKAVVGITDKKLLDELIEIERRITRQDVNGNQLEALYRGIQKTFEDGTKAGIQNPLTEIDAKLESLRDYPSVVTLMTPAESPYNPRAFAINRFLLWRFIQNNHIKHRKGRVARPEPSVRGGTDKTATVVSLWPAPDEKSITRQTKEDYMWRIHRHGTIKSLATDYPLLYDLCKRQLQPKNELDQTRVPAWPDNFFSKKKFASPAPATQQPAATRAISVRRVTEFATFESISCTETFSPFAPESEADGFWIRCKTDITFHVEKIPSGFSLEHRLTPTNPFRFLLTLDDSKLLKRRNLSGDPPWAVAYSFPEKDCEGRHISVTLEGVPATAYPFRDATGFPIFSDMRVKELRWNGIFCGMSPHVVEGETLHNATVLEYRSAIRRLDYEDGDEAQATKTPEYVPLVQTDDRYQANVIWKPHDPQDLYLPSGYFYGTQWDFIEPNPPR